MTELTPEARRTLMAARAAADPTSANKERGRLLLATAIATTAGLTTPSAAAASATSGTTPLGVALGAKLVAGGLALGLAVAGTIALTLPDASSPAPATVNAPAAATETAAATEADSVVPTATGVDPATTTAPTTPNASHTSSPSVPRHAAPKPPRSHTAQVAEEVAWIGQAERALDAGQLRDALHALETHARLFRDGQLQPERHGLRAIVLCRLSDARGRAEATRFLRKHPWSAMTTRVRNACLPLPAVGHDGSDEP